MERACSLRLPIMALVLLALILAIWAGLIRMGWAIPIIRPTLPAVHGPLMIGGFLGTLIALERAVALQKSWTYAVPLVGGLGAVALILGLSVGPWLITLCSLGLVAIFGVILRRHFAFYTVTMALGAVVWLIGNGLWLAGRALPTAVPWWVAFLILTIAGERLELSRIIRLTSYSYALFAVVLLLVLGGLLISLVDYVAGVRLVNLGFVALALWLGWFDIARRTIRRPGLTRFIALNLLLGYFWLGVGGILGLRYAGMTAGPAYDAWLHALLLGFVFSMIFAHAPIIFPAILMREISFEPRLYVALVIMHLGLILRLSGDFFTKVPGRRQ